MAFSSTVAWKSVLGNMRAVCISMVADSGNGDTSASGIGGGITTVYSAILSPISMATAAPKVKIGINNAGTANVGGVSVSACATGDVFYLTVFGR